MEPGIGPSGKRASPLTDEERRWLRRLESCLKDMPPRLLLVECANVLMLVNRAAAKNVSLEDGNARRNGVVLADVKHSAMKVTGVSG